MWETGGKKEVCPSWYCVTTKWAIMLFWHPRDVFSSCLCVCPSCEDVVTGNLEYMVLLLKTGQWLKRGGESLTEGIDWEKHRPTPTRTRKHTQGPVSLHPPPLYFFLLYPVSFLSHSLRLRSTAQGEKLTLAALKAKNQAGRVGTHTHTKNRLEIATCVWVWACIHEPVQLSIIFFPSSHLKRTAGLISLLSTSPLGTRSSSALCLRSSERGSFLMMLSGSLSCLIVSTCGSGRALTKQLACFGAKIS